jgi:putative DNA primase/helicase
MVAEATMMADGDDDRIVPFPGPEPVPDEERARRLRAEVERLARLSPGEYLLYLDDTAKRYGVDKAVLREMIETVIAGIEKKQQEDRGELRRREAHDEKRRDAAERETERRADRAADRAERRARERERAQERRDREAAKAAEKKEKEKQKAFTAIVKLPTVEHEGRLRTLARQLGENIDALREEFAELRGEEEERIRRGEVSPWDEPVNTRELLNDLEKQFGRYIIIHDTMVAPIVPLWICFAWCHDIAAFSSILIFDGADAECAKTAASKMVALLTPRAFIIVEPTGPAYYRFVDRVRPTLVMDDADQLLPRRPDLAHIINASWTRGIPIPRTDPRTGEIHLYNPFTPKVLNGINLLAHLRPATRSRCITINMLPKLEHETVANHRHADRDEAFVILRRKLLRWSIDNMPVLDQAKPAMPEGFFSRREENYYLPFAIADLAGGDWPKKARAAAIKLAREHNEPSLGKRLLAIFYGLFINHGRLLTSAQLEQLVPAEDDAFACYGKFGRPINKFEIAALLKPYGITPGVIHPRGRAADRGYDADWFATAFKHYLGKALPRGRTVVRKPTKKP